MEFSQNNALFSTAARVRVQFEPTTLIIEQGPLLDLNEALLPHLLLNFLCCS
jgi:hypothetical protein